MEFGVNVVVSLHGGTIYPINNIFRRPYLSGCWQCLYFAGNVCLNLHCLVLQWLNSYCVIVSHKAVSLSTMPQTSARVDYLWVKTCADVAKPAADDHTGDEEEAEVNVDDCLARMGVDAGYMGHVSLTSLFI